MDLLIYLLFDTSIIQKPETRTGCRLYLYGFFISLLIFANASNINFAKVE